MYIKTPIAGRYSQVFANCNPLPIYIFIFASPKKLLSDVWLPTVNAIIDAECLTLLLCIDEVHQFVEYGRSTSFCQSFCDIKDKLILPKLVLLSSSSTNNKYINTTVPILCMSATLNKYLVKQ
jgi:hypothetical protein